MQFRHAPHRHTRGETPPVGAFAGPSGARIHHVDAGQGTGMPLVVLHGASGNLLDWTTAPVFPLLAARRRVIAVDRPGFGHSDPAPGRGWLLVDQAEAIRQGLAHLGITRYALVGHSYSGALVLDWALRHPDEVAGLGIVSGATMDWGGALGPQYRLLSAPVLGRAISEVGPRLIPASFVQRALEEIFAPDPVPEHYAREAGVDLALRPRTFQLNARSLEALYRQVKANQPRYGAIGCPVEVVHGTADKVVPSQIHAEPLARVLPNARLTRLSGHGHMPHHGAPEPLAEALLRLP